MANIWDRQEQESEAAYRAFLFFRECPAPRKLRDAYRTFKGDPTKKMASGRWSQWCAQFQWFARATAFDRHLDTFRTQAREQVVAEVSAQRTREVETSALHTLQATASLAHASIKEVV